MQSVGLRKCLYDHELAGKAYFSDATKKNIYKFYPQDGGKSQLALKLRHCMSPCVYCRLCCYGDDTPTIGLQPGSGAQQWADIA